jgi:hypothetical protein
MSLTMDFVRWSGGTMSHTKVQALSGAPDPQTPELHQELSGRSAAESTLLSQRYAAFLGIAGIASLR